MGTKRGLSPVWLQWLRLISLWAPHRVVEEKVEISHLSRGGATYATYKLEHFKSGLFGFTGDLFYTFLHFKSPYLWEPNGAQVIVPECLPKDMPYAMATVFPVWFHAWAQCSHLVVVQCVRRGSYCVLGPVWRHQSAGERHLRKSSRSMIHSAPCVLSGRKLKQKAISFQDQSTLKGEKSIFDVDTSQKEHSHVLQYTAYFNP
jgi:hypothetical protein